ncbi:D-serine deaminase-like pyridoxal phosphate-dependent protein [Roseiarcus fermentans]|uniref:D-serine deaminase-like pyridoxal phosphate-dependent protein n=1 Tax=Roseiarcus fermentans TaxID=1473586 RepID=A0A366ETQ1_9HYPH|nr:alanine racemase [Roseiarcus fermentans]RBP05704.1 D-serine deaminase-like pyridoxal phosphate-dependent protein [Roseiarcus fermentans]
MAWKPSRRAVVGGVAVAAAAGAAIALRPGDRSGPRDPYFLRLQEALSAAGVGTPALVIDRARLDANIATLKRALPEGMGYRVVVKSLPSPTLVSRVRAGTGTDRLMTFNLPMLLAFAAAMPDAGQLLGKPLPILAARSFFAALPAGSRDAAGRIVWLIDTPERFDQYEQLALAQGLTLAAAFELDVGLHRGGQVAGPALGAMYERAKASKALRFAGLMGYEPHIPSIPDALGLRQGAIDAAWSAYGAAKDQARAVLGPAALDGAILNAAGSPTFRLYKDTAVANEVSVGSALVKPADFDTPLLQDFQPAAFIATPVIKTRPDTLLPKGVEFLSTLQSAWDPNSRRTLFIYGGHWLARPVDPPGLQLNAIFGRSSNQEMLNGGEALAVRPDDTVVFRPTQSEAVLLQFGDLLVYDGERIVERWPVLPASA